MGSQHQPAHALTIAHAANWLSRARLAMYLRCAEQDLTLALELYMWNSRLASAAFTDVCHLEVALRNSYNDELMSDFPDWALDSESLVFSRVQGHPMTQSRQDDLNRRSTQLLKRARRAVGPKSTHDRVIAELQFGFWTMLTAPARTSTFWTPYLHRPFPRGTQRSEVHELVTKVNVLRNRLAHNEPVFTATTSIKDRIACAYALFDLIKPRASDFVQERSQVGSLLLECPVPGLV